MYGKDFFAIFEGWEIDRHTAVKSSWSEESFIEDVSTVGRGHDDDMCLVIKSIHLREDLVECLLTLIVTTTDTRTSLLTYGIDLVDKYDTRRFFTSFSEEITHTARTDSDEHLDELRTRDREKWHFCLTCNRTSKKGLPGTRRALEEDTTRDLSSEISVFLRIF